MMARPTRSALPSGEGSLAPLWTFHAGAPLRAGAGFSPGGIAVGSSDGYVHALRPDGAYRWSFTVKGAVAARPLVDERGGVYVATASRRLHALTPSGTLAFSVVLAGTPLDPLVWSPQGEILIATREGLAYAITRAGVVKAAAALREPLTTPPLVLAAGRWIVGGALGDVFTLEGWRVSRARVTSSAVTALAPRAVGYVGIDADGLVFPAQTPPQRAVRLGCGPERVLAVSAEGVVGWLEAGGFQQLGQVREELSAAPACSADGRAFLPLASGALVVLSSGGQRRYRLGTGALFSPLVDDARQQLLVSSVDGRTVALPLGAL
jgi:outer membrane protein assembly factor BamB